MLVVSSSLAVEGKDAFLFIMDKSFDFFVGQM